MVTSPFVKLRQFNFPNFALSRPHTKQPQKIRLLQKFRNPTERLTVTLTELERNTKELDFPAVAAASSSSLVVVVVLMTTAALLP